MKKICIVLSAMLMLPAAGVNAAKMELSQDSSIITVSIDAEKKENGIAVLLRGRDEAGKIIFLDDNYTDENGVYSCKFDASDTEGILTVAANVVGDGIVEQSIIVRTASVEAEVIGVVTKESASKDEIKEVVEKYWMGLGIEEELFDSLADKDAVYELLANDPSSKNIKEYKEFVKAFYAAVIIQKYNECINKNDIITDLNKSPYTEVVGSEYIENYEKLNATVKAKVTDGMAQNYSGSEQFLKDIEFCLLRNCIKYSSLWQEIQPIMSEYKDKIGLNRDATAQDCKNVIGKNYSTYAEILSAVSSGNTSSPSGGGGGGGGGGGSRPSQTPGFSLVETPQNPTEKEEEIVEEKTGEASFTDMENYKWAEPYIKHVYELGIVSGYGDGTFRPEKNVSREEAVKMLMTLFNKDSDTSEVLPFEDVSKDRWSYPYILKAYNNKIVSGMSNNTFGVSREVSRQEMAVMTWNVLKEMGISEKNRLVFSDEDEIAEWAKEAVAILGGCDVIHGRTGKDGLNFEPKEPVTRAEAAVILSNMAKLLP